MITRGFGICYMLNICVRRPVSCQLLVELSGRQNTLSQFVITELGYFLAAKNQFFITNGAGNTITIIN